MSAQNRMCQEPTPPISSPKIRGVNLLILIYENRVYDPVMLVWRNVFCAVFGFSAQHLDKIRADFPALRFREECRVKTTFTPIHP